MNQSTLADAVLQANQWLEQQQSVMLSTLQQWSNINSYSYNQDGLSAMFEEIAKSVAHLPENIETVPLAPESYVDQYGQTQSRELGSALRLSVRPDAAKQVFLCGHMDTVFPVDSDFQQSFVDGAYLKGPGVADMKGGLLVMIYALRAFEMLPIAKKLGWEVLITSDEEVGSPQSSKLFVESARRAQVGLIYEPSLPDGSFVGDRKGSGNFTLVAKGKSAHAGREHHLGRNAIAGLARLLVGIDALNGQYEGVTINLGKVVGGGALNVVPDIATCAFNIRISQPEQAATLQSILNQIVERANQDEVGIRFVLHGDFHRSPKIQNTQQTWLFQQLTRTAEQLDMSVDIKPTGGCCDGNNLSALGVPNIDTMGVIGSGIHSEKEKMLIDSLFQRAQLSLQLLVRLAADHCVFPDKNNL